MTCRHLSLATVLCIWAMLASPVAGQENYAVVALSIEGNSALETDKLLEQMDLYSITWLSEHVLGKPPSYFSSEILRRDLDALKRYYQKEGFLDVRLGPVTVYYYNPTRTVELTIPVEEGSPILVDTVTMSITGDGTHADGSADSIWSAINVNTALQKGRRFRDEDLRRDAAFLASAFGDEGFAHAVVTFDLEVDRQRRRVDIRWNVDPGPVCSFGAIDVTGLDRFPRSWVEEKLRFAEGERYSETLLEDSRLDIYKLGLYHVVAMKVATDSNRNPVLPVTVVTEEARRYRLRLGVGYGKDEKFRVSSDLTLTGFLSGKGRLNVKLRRSELEPFYAAVSYTHPDFLVEDVTLVVNPFYRNQTEPSFEARRVGSRISLQRGLFSLLESSLTWSLERVGMDTSSVAAYHRAAGVQPEYVKSAVSVGLDYVTATPFFDPVAGMHNALLLSLAHPTIGSDYAYSKVIVDLRQYSQISSHLTVASRVKLGASQVIGGSLYPVEERFYAGGVVSVRGWGRHQLGPRDDRGVPVGGMSLLEGSLEARVPMFGGFATAVFLDFGNVWLAEWSFPLSELRYSAGAGLRYNTPIGPIRLDLARPVYDDEREWQLFFSIGHAF